MAGAGGGGQRHGAPPRRMQRQMDATATVEDLRLSELKTLKDDLDCLDRVPKARRWRTAGGAIVTTALGGALGFLLLFDESADYEQWVLPVYLAALGLLVLFAVLCFLAGRDMEAERVTSVGDVSAKLQGVIDSYPEEEP